MLSWAYFVKQRFGAVSLLAGVILFGVVFGYLLPPGAIPVSDKALHASVFFSFTASLYLLCNRALLYAAAAAGLVAVWSEAAQTLFPSHVVHISDVAANIAGVGAFAAFVLIHRLFPAPQDAKTQS